MCMPFNRWHFQLYFIFVLLMAVGPFSAFANPCTKELGTDPWSFQDEVNTRNAGENYYEAHWPEYRDRDKAKLKEFLSKKLHLKRLRLPGGRVLVVKEGTYKQADQLHTVAHESYSVPTLAIGRERTSSFIFISFEDTPDEPLGYYFLSWYPEGNESARELSNEKSTVAEAKLIYVVPSARGTHIGSILFALNRLQALDDSRTDILLSKVANIKIANIYQTLGIEQSGVAAGYNYPLYQIDIRQHRTKYRKIFQEYLNQYATEEGMQ